MAPAVTPPKETVLIVDDEEDICDFLCQILNRLGLETAFAVTGEQAVELIAKKHWHLCVIDLKLSTAVTALDIMKAVREKSPDTIVVAMSGYIDLKLREQAEKFGVHDYLEKPGDLGPEVFSEKIKTLLSNMGPDPKGSDSGKPGNR